MQRSPRRSARMLLSPLGDNLSLGAAIIIVVAVVSSILVALRPAHRVQGMVMWTRARNHLLMYEPAAEAWNAREATQDSVHVYLMSDQALERRMLSGFLAHTHVADLIELERNNAGKVFSGPLEDVGFVDLTERLRSEGLLDQINAPSFSPWSSRGHIFGLPHDVHPVLLAYRADLVEAEGIDPTRVQTWDEFARVLRPMIRDLDGDGQPDRYLLNYWHTNMDQTETLMLQAGGAYFDEQGRPVIDSEVNADVASRLVAWCSGPERIAIDAPEFNASGNRLRLEGAVICSLVPDWLCGVWRAELPGLGGKVKLMPLPAWRTGGCRTSVWGGSMLGVARTAPHFEEAWAFAKYLYMSPQIAETLYRTTGIISPVKSLWTSAFYDEPSAFFCDQAPGRMYVSMAPDVPRRTSSPFITLAKAEVRDAMVELRRYAVEHQQYDADALKGEARRVLTSAQQRVRQQMARNVFVAEGD